MFGKRHVVSLGYKLRIYSPIILLCHGSGLELLKLAIEKAGYTGLIQIGMDVAASEFCKEGKYDLDFKNPNSNPADWVTIYIYDASFKYFHKYL